MRRTRGMAVAPARGRADGHEHRRSDETELRMIRTLTKKMRANAEAPARSIVSARGPSIRQSAHDGVVVQRR